MLEVLILADRIFILSGEASAKRRVDLPRERGVTSPEFNALKRDLLSQVSLNLF
jgi:sulfonate transport system ATP-binding protein